MGFHRLWPLGQPQALGSVIVCSKSNVCCLSVYLVFRRGFQMTTGLTLVRHLLLKEGSVCRGLCDAMGRVIRGSRKGKSLIFTAKTRLREGCCEASCS